MTCPLCYDFCNQTVTLYRKTDTGVLRQVLTGCFLQWQDNQRTDALGKSLDPNFLLILPGKDRKICPGDRIVSGIGPESVSWEKLIPGITPGSAEVSFVKPCFWEGTQCHLEAGRGGSHGYAG